jgi:protease II
VFINNFELFDNHIVIHEKEKAQPRLRVINLTTQKDHIIKFKEDIYNVSIGYNPDFNTDTLQFSYSTFLTPNTVYNYNMETQEKRIVKRRKWKENKYSPFKVERIWATAKDGKKIPITLFYSKWIASNKKEPEKNKVWLTSY